MDFAKLVGNGRAVLAAIEAQTDVSECGNTDAAQNETQFLTGHPKQRPDLTDQRTDDYSEADQWAFLDNSDYDTENDDDSDANYLPSDSGNSDKSDTQSRSVIDTLMYILHCFNCEPGASWTFIRCIHTATVPLMSESTLQLPEYKPYNTTNMTGSRWVVLPVLNISHWFLIVFDFYDREIKVYSSLPDSDRFRVAVRYLTNLWKPYLMRVVGRDDVMKWQPSIKFSPSLTNNRDDSCLYIVKIVDYLVGRRALNFGSDAIKADRGRIVYNLLASSYYPGSFPAYDV